MTANNNRYVEFVLKIVRK